MHIVHAKNGERFTAEEMGRRWAKLYREVLAEKSKSLAEDPLAERPQATDN